MVHLTPERVERLRKVVRWVRGRVLTPVRVLPDISQSRRFALNFCDLRLKDSADPGSGQNLKLGVIGGFPVLEYVRLGYDWLAPYYNPLLLFDEVHYFQTYPAPPMKYLAWSYRFYIHQFNQPHDVIRVCQKYDICILRAYDPEMGKVATDAAKTLKIPVVISVH